MRIIQLKTLAGHGGAETLLLQITRELLAREHLVHTVLGERGWLEAQMIAEKQPVECIPLTSIYSVAYILRLVDIIRRKRAQVVLSHGARVNLVGAIAASIAGIPSVSVEHNVDNWRTSWVMNIIDRKIASLNAHRIAVSRAVGMALIDLKILQVEKITVIPNGVFFPSVNLCENIRRQIRQRFGFNDEHVVFCTVARLVEQKGHRYLLDIIPHIKREFPQIRFLFLGDGPLRANLEGRARSLGIYDLIHFAGAVDGVISLLPAFEGFVLPSLWEGMPVALIEAMGMGIPVIATRVAGTPEVVTDGITGLLVPPSDSASLLTAIRRLYLETELRIALAQRGQVYVHEHHSIEKVVQRYISVLNNVITSAPTASNGC